MTSSINSICCCQSSIVCNLFNKFYRYTLANYYGVGKAILFMKDRVKAYMTINQHYIDFAANETTYTNSEFIGVINEKFVLFPDVPVTNFYNSDADAYAAGVTYKKLYYLTQENIYGLPYGTVKVQVEYGA